MKTMKLVILAFVLGLSSLATAQSKGGADIGSAFVNGDILYVTLLGDTCNSFSAGLEVESLCLANRLSTNFQTKCNAQLMVSSTRMACPRGKKPHIFEINLREALLTREAEELTIDVYGKKILVKVQ